MDRNWAIAKREWDDFLLEINILRKKVGCQSRSGWFRGVKKSSYELLPTAYRDHFTVASLLEDVSRHDVIKLIKRKDNRAANAIDDLNRSGKLSVQYAKFILDGFKHATEQQEADLAIANLLGSILGERDAFHEFYNRSRTTDASSWFVLAGMRHHGVPTRLIDWTESLLVSVYFALEKYVEYLVPKWRKIKTWSGDFPPFIMPKHLSIPGVWILNPFHLAEESGIIGIIPYPDMPPVPDYYQSILTNKTWPFRKAIPLHAPKAVARMESQRGHFTVHGNDSAPLEQQVKRNRGILERAFIPKRAAVYGTYFLWQHANFDKYELYRDLDTLGSVVAARHFPGRTQAGWAYFEHSGKYDLRNYIENPASRRRIPRSGDQIRVHSEFYLRGPLGGGEDPARWRIKTACSMVKKGSKCMILDAFVTKGIVCLYLQQN